MHTLSRSVARSFMFVVIIFGLIVPTIGRAATQQSQSALSKAELQDLVEPIALYPDALLQDILAAATFPDQIIDAALLIRSKEDAKRIQQQNWDQSVKVIATYPGILSTMHSKIDWTTALGQAFLQQHGDLLAAIQVLRSRSAAAGQLATNQYQNVTSVTREGGVQVIVIESQSPEVIYVPSSTESSSRQGALTPLVSFGLGLALGAAMNDDDDYHHYYYGRWGGPAFWYDESPYNKWLDNRREAWEDYNDRAWDRQEFNQDMREDRQDFRQDQIESGNRNRPSAEQRSEMRQNASERRAAGQERVGATSPANREAMAQSRGWSSPPATRTQSRSAFSGYESRGQVSSYGSRGQASRGSAAANRGGGRRR